MEFTSNSSQSLFQYKILSKSFIPVESRDIFMEAVDLTSHGSVHKKIKVRVYIQWFQPTIYLTMYLRETKQIVNKRHSSIQHK